MVFNQRANPVFVNFSSWVYIILKFISMKVIHFESIKPGLEDDLWAYCQCNFWVLEIDIYISMVLKNSILTNKVFLHLKWVCSGVHSKIDFFSSRFEPPLNLPKQPSASSDSLFVRTYTTEDPFYFDVVRKSTGRKIFDTSPGQK